ncbi:MAG TPA: tetratricopeptide repeat protein [Planctomycetota bacterium]|nr:tetratricopeptide repeat protein [Planctomycetota bacterium]
MSQASDRAGILIQQGRYDLAEQELRKALSEDPESGRVHSRLALCLAAQDRLPEAYPEVARGIQLDPSSSFGHYVGGLVHLQGNRYEEAEASVRRAIELDPDDPDFRALLARTHLVRSQWTEALAAAEAGLQLFAEHAECMNLRAMALTKLGRTGEASADIESALEQDPEDGLAHANQGWLLLHRGKGKDGIVHFREALRIDPTDEFARAGLVEALKARNRIYGLFLVAFLWLSRFSGRGQFAIIIGAYVLFQVLRGVSKSNPALAPYLTPLLVAYLVFVLFSWFGTPFFNLLLRLDREGRRALSAAQRQQSNAFVLLLAGGTGAMGYYLAGKSEASFLVGVMCYGLLFPTMSFFNCDPGWPRKFMAAYIAGMAIVGLSMLGLFLAGKYDGAVNLLRVFLLAAVLSQLVGPAVARASPRR